MIRHNLLVRIGVASWLADLLRPKPQKKEPVVAEIHFQDPYSRQVFVTKLLEHHEDLPVFHPPSRLLPGGTIHNPPHNNSLHLFNSSAPKAAHMPLFPPAWRTPRIPGRHLEPPP
jgi:hypothetical protein